MKFRSFLSSALQKVAELIGIGTAALKGRYEADQEKKRAADQEREYAVMLAYNEQDYYLVAELLVEAINNTVDVTGAFSIKNVSQVIWLPFLDRMPDGVWVFRFHARYRKGFGTTAETIQRILQAELDRLTGIYQYPSLKVFVTFGPDGTVVIRVAYACDLLAARKVVI